MNMIFTDTFIKTRKEVRAWTGVYSCKDQAKFNYIWKLTKYTLYQEPVEEQCGISRKQREIFFPIKLRYWVRIIKAINDSIIFIEDGAVARYLMLTLK